MRIITKDFDLEYSKINLFIKETFFHYYILQAKEIGCNKKYDLHIFKDRIDADRCFRSISEDYRKGFKIHRIY